MPDGCAAAALPIKGFFSSRMRLLSVLKALPFVAKGSADTFYLVSHEWNG